MQVNQHNNDEEINDRIFHALCLGTIGGHRPN